MTAGLFGQSGAPCPSQKTELDPRLDGLLRLATLSKWTLLTPSVFA